MGDFNVKKLFKSKAAGNIIILMALITLLYLLISVYFARHFFFNTRINGVNVSLKAHDNVGEVIKQYIKDYKLDLFERNGQTEVIVGQNIDINYNDKNSIHKIIEENNSFKWLGSLLSVKQYYVEDLFSYNRGSLENVISELNCLNKDIIEPKNVSFKYSNGFYEAVEEIYGNKIIKENLNEAIEISILKGEMKLDLEKSKCYENPKYTLSSEKTLQANNLLNSYIKSKVTYKFSSESELVDESIINKWLSVDENLDVVIDEKAVLKYVEGLSKKYDTVGIIREFKTSMGKTLEVKGGFYGWKIDCPNETKALLENIKLGEVLEKEPIYTQRAVARDKDDIGNTYVEVNISRQHLWFYRDGKLITQGAVVTGNPNRGNSTKVGIYMLNYKEKGSTLRGHDYEAEVTYWMPFNGNIGIHDATWRYSFGGEIYKRNGTHGCVNAPLYLAKTIFENIEPGTPIICYEE